MSIRIRAALLAIWLTVFGLGLSNSSQAQEAVNPDASQAQEAVNPDASQAQEVVNLDAFIDDVESLDNVDQNTPLNTAQRFMRFVETGEYERAAEYLDLRYLPDGLGEADGAALAEKLYIVISRKVRIDFGALSDEPEGRDGDGLPSYRDSFGTMNSKQGAVSIYLQRIPGDNDALIWKVSNATVAQIPQLYKDYGYSPIVERVRRIIPRGSFLGAELFKWAIAFLAGSGVVCAWLIIAWPLGGFLTRNNVSSKQRVKQYLRRPIPTLIFFVTAAWALRELGLGVTASRLAEGSTLVAIAIVWFLFATTNLLRDVYSKFLRARGRESALMLLSPITGFAKVLIATFAIIIWLDNIGVNVTALVAGVGVGGFAIALGLQKPLEDIMGAITLYTQQPVKIGQFCTCGDVTGTVEGISLRTTRIRTLGNTVVIMPNAIFATASIENITARNRILHRQTVRLALTTSDSLMRSVLEGLRTVLADTEAVLDDSSRATLIGFGEFSIDIEIFAHVDTTDWNDFLAIAEGINLATVNVLERTGARLAEPPR